MVPARLEAHGARRGKPGMHTRSRNVCMQYNRHMLSCLSAESVYLHLQMTTLFLVLIEWTLADSLEHHRRALNLNLRRVWWACSFLWLCRKDDRTSPPSYLRPPPARGPAGFAGEGSAEHVSGIPFVAADRPS